MQGNNPFNKISHALEVKLNSLSPNEKTQISLWLDDVNHESIKKLSADKCGINHEEIFTEKYSDEEIQNYIETKREISRIFYNKLNKKFASEELKQKEIIGMSEYSPVIWANLTKSNTNYTIYC